MVPNPPEAVEPVCIGCADLTEAASKLLAMLWVARDELREHGNNRLRGVALGIERVLAEDGWPLRPKGEPHG